jgi:signal transduction histidine kinase
LAIKLCKFAHELNNSLTIISGHAELLRTEFSVDELISAHATAIQQAVRHAAEIIDSCQCALAHMEYMDKARAGAGHYSPLEIPKISRKH